MLKRKIEQQLLTWKQTPNHKPLIIKGCRQCGKTFSVRKFCEENYENTVYINFFNNPNYSAIFRNSLEVDDIIMMMSALMGNDTVFVPYKTAIIFDEIQDCPEARTALKFFHLDGRYDVIGTGSLLGYKGAIFENLAADFFAKMGRKLYYFHKDSGLEIDFFIRYKGKCMPVEIKAAQGNAKSLKTVMKNKDIYHIDYAIKLGNYNIGEENNILMLPLYMGFLLSEY